MRALFQSVRQVGVTVILEVSAEIGKGLPFEWLRSMASVSYGEGV